MPNNETVAGCTDTGTVNSNPPKVAGTGEVQVIAKGGLQTQLGAGSDQFAYMPGWVPRRRLRGHPDHRVDLRCLRHAGRLDHQIKAKYLPGSCR